MIILRSVSGFILLCVAAQLIAGQPNELDKAKSKFGQGVQTEPTRVSYVTTLLHMRERFAKAKNEKWQAVDAEIMRHPAPADSATFSKLLIGEWASPRHEYVFKSDGTWSMLPAEPDATRGKWRIEGNQYVDTDLSGHSTKYTIILLTQKDFVFTDGQVVFYETRIEKE